MTTRTKPKNNRKRKPHSEWLNVSVDWYTKSAAEQKDFIQKRMPDAWKKAADDENTLIGYASVFGGPPDSHGDIISEGAFRKTIRERVKQGLVKLLDSHVYDSAHTLGTVVDAVEDDYGLMIQARLSTAGSVLDIKKKMTEGILDKLSIGFDSVKERFAKDPNTGEMVRYLDEIKLYEISVVPIPALERAQILAVKAVVPFQDFPLAGRAKAWDEKQAAENVQAALGDDLNKYRRAFLYYDADNPEDLTSYKYMIADYQDGRLVANPQALEQVAKELEGKSGEEIDGIKEQLNLYFAKMREEFDDDSIRAPWEVDEWPEEDSFDDMPEESLLDMARRLMEAMEERGIKAEPMERISEKAGRRHSSNDAAKIGAAINALMDLLTDEEQADLMDKRKKPKKEAAPKQGAAPADEPRRTSYEERMRRLKLKEKEFQLKGGKRNEL